MGTVRRRVTLIVAVMAGLAGSGAATAGDATVPAGWAPDGVPLLSAGALLRSDVEGAGAACGENAALLVRIGKPRLLRRWSAALGDALVRKGWSVHDLQVSGGLRADEIGDRLVAAAARCTARTLLVASYGDAIASTRRAVHHLPAPTRGQVRHVTEVPDGARRIAWSRAMRPASRALTAWPLLTVNDALAGVTQDGIRLGARTAPVVLETFVDLQSPQARDYLLEVLPRLVARYVRSGEVQMRARPVASLGTDSLRAAQLAAAAAQQDRVWSFFGRFVERQGGVNTGYVTDDFLYSTATRAGLDADGALAARGSRAVDELLQRAWLGWRRAGVGETPGFTTDGPGGTYFLHKGAWARPSAIEAAIQLAMSRRRRAADADSAG